MNINIDLREFENKLKKAGKNINETINQLITKTVLDTEKDLQSNPPVGTPVDTGVARAGWQYKKVSDNEHTLINNVDYIEYLNQGTSKQSPKKFVEKAIQKNIKELENDIKNI